MNNEKDYLWLVKTNRGGFFITVIGNWTPEEAAKRIWLVFEEIKLGIIGMIPRKQPTGPDDERGLICQLEEPKDGRDFEFLAGKKFFEVWGRSTEYEVTRILLDKQMGGEDHE